MARTITVLGTEVLLANGFSPTPAAEQEGFLDGVGWAIVSYAGPMTLARDFNCTVLPGVDRSDRSTAEKHRSPALQQL